MTLANNFVSLSLVKARASLDTACENLDQAVRLLPAVDGDTVMASPGLVTLLLDVVAARRQVRGLEEVIAMDVQIASRSSICN
jgi:hypothetical protein